MIEVIKYIDPLWYFNIKVIKDSNFYFPNYHSLQPEEKQLIKFDSQYEKMALADAAFQALKKGVWSTDASRSLDKSAFENMPTVDLYRFARKYYAPVWVFYFCTMRLLLLNNPIKEIRAFFKTINVRKVNLFDPVAAQRKLLTLPPALQVSIILPTMNRYQELADLLKDLAEQTISAFEIIVIDQSSIKNKVCYTAFAKLPLKLIFQQERGQWTARNKGIEEASGDFVLFVDDDSRVANDWIEQHLKAIFTYQADISAGVSVSAHEALGKDKSFFHVAEEFDTGNVMVTKEALQKIGEFDIHFNGYRMGDSDFGLRAYLSGVKSISNPLAKRIHVHTSKGGLRDWGSVKAFEPVSFWGHRPDVGVLYFFRKHFQTKYLVSFLVVRIYLSFLPKRINNVFLKYSLGTGLFLLCVPWFTMKLFLAFKKSNRMLSSL